MRVENGYYVWSRGSGEALSSNFNAREFECGCQYADCVTNCISIECVESLQKAREEFGKPVKVTSGYRCLKHNRDVGSKDTSQHVLGNAVDSVPKEHTTESLDNWVAVVRKYFKAIGLSPRFVHVDIRNDKKREWVY